MDIASWQKAAVDAIREEALSLGWTMDELYGKTSPLPFPYGGAWGLVAQLHLHEETMSDGRLKIMDTIGRITSNRIEIRTMRTLNGKPFIDDKGQEIGPIITGFYR